MSENKKLEALESIENNSSTIGEKIAITHETIDPINGWIDFDRSKISYGGILYPETYRFQVKPATAGTIKYFSTLDENNPMSVNDALTYVVKNQIRVFDGQRLLNTLDAIYEHDRLFFVLLVHVYSGSTTSLSFKTSCTNEKCRKQQDVEITPYNLRYKESDSMKWLNTSTGMFNIETKDMGSYVYRPLTLSESADLTEFMMKSRNTGDEIEKFFLTAAPFITAKPTGLQKQEPKDIYQEYLRLTSDSSVVSLLSEITTNHITIGQKLEVDCECSKCNRLFHSPISSIAGIRNIFLVRNIASQLL